MESCKDVVATTHRSRGILTALVAAIGSAWTLGRDRKTKARAVRYVSWAGRAQTDSWFQFQLEQSKSRALYYYSRNETR
jgi:hypothetical protein